MKTFTIQNKSSHNAFNQSENSRYSYSDLDIEVIATNSNNALNAKFSSYLGITETIKLNQLQIESIINNPEYKFFGIYKDHGHYASYAIVNQEGIITCKYKNSLGKKLEKLEQDFKKFKTESTLVKVQILEEGKINQHTKSSTGIFALKNLVQLLNGKENFYSPKTLKEINATRRELAYDYLQFVKNQYLEWQKLDIYKQQEILSKLNPLIEKQFKSVTEVKNPQRELAKLLVSAIENLNSGLAKLALKAGLIVNNGIELQGSKVSFRTILENEIPKHSDVKELKQIEKLLIKHGCSIKLQLSTTKIKELEHQEILRKVAQNNYEGSEDVGIEIYGAFQHLLKANLSAAIKGIQSVASDKVVLKQTPETLSSHLADLILNKALKFILENLKLAPISIPIAGLWDLFFRLGNTAKFKEFAKFFGGSDFEKAIIDDYSIRIIKHYSEEIISNKIDPLLLENAMKWAYKIPKRYILGEGKKFSFGGKDYTDAWNILSSRYTAKFIEFLATDEARKNFANLNFGTMSAKYLFEFHRVSKEEIQNITTEFTISNVKTFAKLASYLSEIAKYPKSVAISYTTYWCDTHNQSKENGIDAKSVIIASNDKIIICYNASAETNKVKYSDETKKIGDVDVPMKLYDDFYKFYDNAQYYSSNDSNAKAKSLKVILYECLKNYSEAKVYLVGDKLGSVMAALTHLHIASHSEVYKVPEQLNLYTYGELPWCHSDSAEKAQRILKNYYRIIISDDDIEESENYKLIGEVHYLVVGQLLNESNFKALESETKKRVQPSTIRDYIDELDKKDIISNKELNQNSEEVMQDGMYNIDLDTILAQGWDVNSYSYHLTDALIQAARNGDIKLVRNLVEEDNVDVNYYKQDYIQGRKARVERTNYVDIGIIANVLEGMYTISSQDSKFGKDGFLILVKYLLKKGAYIDQTAKFPGDIMNFHGHTYTRNGGGYSNNEHDKNFRPIDVAARNGDLTLVKFLVSSGASHDNVLCNAITSNNFELVKYLVEGIESKVTYNWFFDSNDPLAIAGKIGDMQIVKYLVSKGASPSSNNILQDAVRIGEISTITYLIEKGAKPTTALHDAAEIISLNAFKILVERGGDIFFKNAKKQTPLDILHHKLNADQSANTRECDKQSIKQYLIILELQNQRLTFEKYEKAFDELIESKDNWYNLSTYFVSECIRINNALNQKLSNKSLTQKEKTKLDLEQKMFIEKQKQFFETYDGDTDQGKKIKIYNSAIKLLLNYSNPKRFIEAEKVCEELPQDQDLLFLKGIVYITQIGGNINSESTKYFYKKTSEVLDQLQESIQSLYLQGELNYAQGNHENALNYYKNAVELDPCFNHPKARIIEILTKQNKYEESKKISDELVKEILSIDVELIVQGVNERMDTKDLMDGQNAKASVPQNFDFVLKEALAVDAKRTREKLKELMPNELNKLKLYDDNRQLFYADNTFKQIKYAYDKIKCFFGGKIFGSKNFVPESEQHLFFEKINTLISKLSVIKTAVNDQYDLGGFNSIQAKAQYINIIEDLINYYECYIKQVIVDYQYSQDPYYFTKFNNGTGNLLDVKKSIAVYTERQLNTLEQDENKSHNIDNSYLLRFKASEHLTIKEPSGEQKYGTHKIVVWPPQGNNQVYYKYSPYAPGIEFAVSSLYEQILPHSTPETMLIKLSEGKNKAIYLASKGVTGRNFNEVMNQPEVLQTIDMKNFSGLFISSFLVCTGDAKPDNFILHFNYDTRGLRSTELISVDNDIAFCRQKLSVFNEKNQQKKLYADMLNILYLMPQMNELVSPDLKEYLLKPEKQPEIVISKWLGSLYQKNETYNRLLSLGFDKADLEQMKLPIKLPIGTAAKMYSDLSKIIKLLSSEAVTHNDILELLSPSLVYFYNKYRDNASIVNSLKNIYVAAGADPNIVNSLYNPDKTISSEAWNIMSAAKRKDPRIFKEIFKSEIEHEAEKFIAAIDFSNQDDEVLLSIKQNLNFVKELSLNKINADQLEILLENTTFKYLSKIEIIDGQINLEQQKILSVKYQNLINFKNESTKNLIPSIVPIAFNIENIWDLMDNTKRPSGQDLVSHTVNDRLMQTIKEQELDINAQDKQGNTVLHAAVLSGDRVIIKPLLDCGIDINLVNHNGNKAIDLSEKHPEIILMILDHQPLYFQQLIKQEKVAEAEIIAKSINKSYFMKFLEGNLIGEASSVLQNIMENHKLKTLAQIALIKLKKTTDTNLLHLFATNYTDEDLNILSLLLQVDPNLVNAKDKTGMVAADIALVNKKYNMLCMLLNNSSTLTQITDDNINLIVKAAKNAIKIDPSDFKTKFNYQKTDGKGNTIFHLMCKTKDQDIFKYQDILTNCREIKNKENKDIYDLAKEEDFIEMLKLLYFDQELYNQENIHKLAKDEQTHQLSQFLKTHGFEITIEEARFGINLYSKVDQKGNSVLQKLIKEYVVSPRGLLLKNIEYLLQYSDKYAKDYINYTSRADGNTSLHLATIAANTDIINMLSTYEGLNSLVFNSQKQTALDLAKMFFSSSTDLVRDLRIISENHNNEGGYDKKLLEITKLENRLLDIDLTISNINDFTVECRAAHNLLYPHIEHLLYEITTIGEY